MILMHVLDSFKPIYSELNEDILYRFRNETRINENVMITFIISLLFFLKLE